jgi:hypothetical protein
MLTHCYGGVNGHESLHAPNKAVIELRRRQAQQKEANANFDKHNTNEEERLADKVDVQAFRFHGWRNVVGMSACTIDCRRNN